MELIQTGSKLKEYALESLYKIFEPYAPYKIKNIARDVIIMMFEEMKRNNQACGDKFYLSLKNICFKVEEYLKDYFSVTEMLEIVDVLLLGGITWANLNFLEFIESLALNNDYSPIIQLKVLWEISFILKN